MKSRTPTWSVRWCCDEFYRLVCRPRLRGLTDWSGLGVGIPFRDELRFLNGNLDNGPGSNVFCISKRTVSQIPPPRWKPSCKALDLGGEGVVVRNPAAPWIPKRHKDILKYKPFEDAEAVITGFTSGRETAKGSKHLGRIGA